MHLDPATLRRLWPRAPQALIDAVASRSADVFARHGLTTPLRVTHFLAQISHESGGGTIVEESLNYTTPARIAAVWPRRFTAETATAFTHNPRKLADSVYNGRMGNRPGTEDGYDFRGRGLLQITGRDSYRAIGALTDLPLEERPELAYAPTATLEVAAAEFQHLGCLPFCDKDNVEAVTRRVNGGYTGLAQRKAWLAKWRAALPQDADEPAPIPAEPHTEADPHPEPPTLPRGSDETLPPGVDNPGKTDIQSKTIWATIVTMITSGTLSIGELLGPVKELLADPATRIVLLVAILAAGGFVIYDRRKRLRQDHV